MLYIDFGLCRGSASQPVNYSKYYCIWINLKKSLCLIKQIVLLLQDQLYIIYIYTCLDFLFLLWNTCQFYQCYFQDWNLILLRSFLSYKEIYFLLAQVLQQWQPSLHSILFLRPFNHLLNYLFFWAWLAFHFFLSQMILLFYRKQAHFCLYSAI